MSPERKVPVDNHHRKAIQERLGDTLFVEAGAGTGKTTQLVGRVVGLVESGVEMRRIAAITFTEAAAAELRSRIREALEKSASAGSTRARDAIGEVDEAAISTLHSFAQRILAEHSLEAGLPPVFDVRDEIQSGLAFQEWWSATLEELLTDPGLHKSWFRFLALGLKANRLRLIAKTLHDHWDRLEARSGGPAGPSAAELDAALDAATARAVRELGRAGEAAADCGDPADSLCRVLVDMGRLADEAPGLVDHALLARMSMLLDRKGRGKGANWGQGVAPAESARDLAFVAIKEVIQLVCDSSFRRLMEAVAAKVMDAAEERRRNGELEFHDLLVLARRLLRTDPGVRTRLKDRWQRLLIDEFQDTDPIQVELAALMATESDDVVEKQLAGLEPGRLFFVGDARQSIYRFRRADLALFQSVANALEEDRISLTQNFRSVPGITEWVNKVIGPMLKANQYEALQPFRKPLTGTKGPVVRVLGEPSTENLPSVRAREAEEIAWSLKYIVGAGGLHPAWQVPVDDESTATRDARYDDIAILLPTRASLSFIERALEDEKIPYRVESSSLVWATQEVRDLLACLRAIDDAGDEVSVVAALRSVVLGCSDEDLLEWAQAGGKWNVNAHRPEALPADHPVFVGLTKLLALSEERFWAGVSGLVERTARELGFFELALANSRSRDSWRRLRHVIDEVRAFERGGGASLRNFLVWAEAQDAEGARAKEAVLPQPDHRAVRILTVHGAKGLEFPICILAGLNSAGPGPNLGRVLWDGNGTMEAAFRRDRRTSGFSSLEDDEKREEGEEDKRLLYVAATRAKDHLIVSLHHKDDSKAKAADRSHAGILWEACAEHPDLWTTMPAELPLSAVPQDPPAPQGDLAGERREWSAARNAALSELSRSNVRAATEMKGDVDDSVERQPWQRGRGGTSLGRAVHATLQTIDLATGEALADTARAQAAAEGIAHRAREVEARVRAALGSAVAAEAAKAQHWRELYVGAPVDDLTVEGYIDLLYETDDGLVLVDWKTDALDPRTEQTEALARYGKQVQAYADVLEVALGRKVLRAELVFLSDKEAVPVTIELSGAPAL